MWKLKLRRKELPVTLLSPHLRDTWVGLPIRHLILATSGFIVFIDFDLDVDWKSTPKWDSENETLRRKFAAVLAKAATIEAGDWDRSDEQKTLNFKRQIGEAVARGLEGNFAQADELLTKAEKFRQRIGEALHRKEIIKDQVKIKRSWKLSYQIWTALHYGFGIAALLLSTLVASKPIWLDASQLSFVAWLVAAFTALLTFLTPDKKADKYIRAWSVLNSEITLYNADEERTIEDVLDAYRRGQDIIYESTQQDRQRRRP